MSALKLLKTSFTAGEIAPELYGRSDLAAYDNGAARLRNVFVHPTGGVSRRDGLRHIATARGALQRAVPTAATAPNGGTAGAATDDDPASVLATTAAIGTTANYVALRCDLGAAKTVRAADAVGMFHAGTAAEEDWRIEYSADDASWTAYGEPFRVDARAASFRRAPAAVAARYWRVLRPGNADLGAATLRLGDFLLWQETAAIAPGRLIAFEFNTEQIYLLLLQARGLAVHAAGAIAAELPLPYAAGEIGTVAWAQSADTLLLVHPDRPPLKVVRRLVKRAGIDVAEWKACDWRYVEEESKDKNGTVLGNALRQPYHKFAELETTVAASGTVRDTFVTLTASAPAFEAGHVGLRLRLNRRETEIQSVASATSATALVKETLTGTAATRDWEEPAFSALRGWPASCTFHQDRLVLGGSRDLPNRLWLSKSADLFNFDLGEGLDDEAIEFAMLSDQVDAIRAVHSGRHLQLFTSGGEWMVQGDPLTPENVQLKRQTRIGSRLDRFLPPRDVDGSTLFVQRDGKGLREFQFTDIDNAYQAIDLATLARHVLAAGAVDLDYDGARRLLHLVVADGTLATVTIYRAEQVTAWSVQATAGLFRAVAVAGTETYALVERSGSLRIERFEPGLGTDAAFAATAAPATANWSGFAHLNGQTAALVADGVALPPLVVAGGAVSLAVPAARFEIGLPFATEIDALPPASLQPRVSNLGTPVRLVAATFRLQATRALRVDWGRGARDVPLRRIGPAGALEAPPSGAPAPFTGDATVRALGWKRGTAPLWRIRQDLPLPLTVLSVSAAVKAGN